MDEGVYGAGHMSQTWCRLEGLYPPAFNTCGKSHRQIRESGRLWHGICIGQQSWNHLTRNSVLFEYRKQNQTCTPNTYQFHQHYSFINATTSTLDCMCLNSGTPWIQQIKHGSILFQRSRIVATVNMWQRPVLGVPMQVDCQPYP